MFLKQIQSDSVDTYRIESENLSLTFLTIYRKKLPSPRERGFTLLDGKIYLRQPERGPYLTG